MTARPSGKSGGRAAWVVWAITAVLMVAWVPLVRVATTQEGTGLSLFLSPVVVLGFATVGALITSRQPRNRIGLVYAWLALAGAIGLVGGAYASIPFHTALNVPAVRFAAWLGRVGFALMIAPLTFVFLLFPDGQVPTRRWRPLLWVMLALTAINQLGYALAPGPVAAGFTYTPRSVTNPFGLPIAWKGWVEPVTSLAGFAVLLGGLLGVVALVFRYRRAALEERQQIRWLAYVGAAAAGILIVGMVASAIANAMGANTGESDTFFTFVLLPFALVLMIGIPAASVVSVLRYRLWDLDVVVKKTVVAAVLVVLMGGAGALLLGTIGQIALWRATPRGISVAVGVVIGLLFIPVLRLSRRIADRVVYGGRATPYEVLTRFSERMADTYSTEDVLPRMASILAAGTGAELAVIWLLARRELRPAATWPPDSKLSPSFSVDHMEQQGAFEVRHLGELLGAITVAMPPNDPMNPGKERIVRDLAAQAGLVLRNVKLIEDLRASRQRLVAAQDEERRRIERNLHDGAQQQLVALSVKLRLAEQLADRDLAKAKQMLSQLQADTSEALENLRDLARGIYPPLLADKGLPEALAAQARKLTFPVKVESDGVGRYPPEVEATIYFCTLEALQNVAKYADAAHVRVRLSAEDGQLVFEVKDDGSGFDPNATGYGTGLQGMADRLDAIGGTLEVRSAPGAGTTLIGTVPV